MIIGITGTLGAGKTETAKILSKYNFKHLSVRGFLIEELKKRGMEINRDNMVIVANELREKYSPSYIVEKLYEIAKESEGNFVIESIRTLGEVSSLKEKGDFYLIAVDANIQKRYERVVLRKSESDRVSFEKFKQDEEREMWSNDINKQNLKGCIAEADVRIINNGTLLELEEDIKNILKIIGTNKIQQKTITENKTSKREDFLAWDDYFMGVALLSAKRSKDPNTQVGACIVDKNNKIVGVGYNGFPIGCSDDSLPWGREGSFLETKYPYVCHAELNAILNSTKSLEGCRIYVPLFPCGECAKAIIQSGIKEVIYMSDKYSDKDSFKAARKLFNESGIRCKTHTSKKGSVKIDFSPESV